MTEIRKWLVGVYVCVALYALTYLAKLLYGWWTEGVLVLTQTGWSWWSAAMVYSLILVPDSFRDTDHNRDRYLGLRGRSASDCTVPVVGAGTTPISPGVNATSKQLIEIVSIAGGDLVDAACSRIQSRGQLQWQGFHQALLR